MGGKQCVRRMWFLIHCEGCRVRAKTTDFRLDEGRY